MGRPRHASNLVLPSYLYAQKKNQREYFLYRRPDTGQTISFGSHPEQAIAAAELVNDLFGVGDAPVKQSADLFRSTAIEKINNGKVSSIPAWLREKFPDLFGLTPTAVARMKTERVTHWANTPVENRQYAGSMFVLAPKLNPQRPPEWVTVLYKAAKNAAARRKRPFDLTEAEIVELVKESGGYCPVSGVRLRLDACEDARGKIKRPWSPSLDRIDSTKGYAKDNCRVVCLAVNFAMNMWGEEILITLAKSMAARATDRRFKKVSSSS